MGEFFCGLFAILIIIGLCKSISSYSYGRKLLYNMSSIKISIIAFIVIAIIGGISFTYVLWSADNILDRDTTLSGFAAAGCIISYLAIGFALTTCPNREEIYKRVDEIYIQGKKEEILQQIYAFYDEEVRNVPNNACYLNVIEHAKGLGLRIGTFYAWVNNATLYFLATDPTMESVSPDDEIYMYKVKKLPIVRIECFSTQGEIYRENKISGGGGGGTSLSGAVVGGIIAGEAGAVIGSRKKFNPITSELITFDTRETYLNYFNKKEYRKTIHFDFEDYQTLLSLIPEKDLRFATDSRVKDIAYNNLLKNNSKEIAEQIKEIAELKKSGILTEDEFTSKKRELLAKI